MTDERSLQRPAAAGPETGLERRRGLRLSPLFLSLDAAGRPDLYLNTIVGCVRKWYGEEEPAALFQSWAGDRRQALLDDLAWLVLESAAYARELPARPLLAELRRVHAASAQMPRHSRLALSSELC